MAWTCNRPCLSPAPRKKKTPTLYSYCPHSLANICVAKPWQRLFLAAPVYHNYFPPKARMTASSYNIFFKVFHRPVGVKHFILTSPAPQPTSVCPRLYIERNQAVYNQFLSALQFTSVIWQKVCHSTSNLSLFTGQWLGNKCRSWLILLLMEGVKICIVGLVAAPMITYSASLLSCTHKLRPDFFWAHADA
jgi:hypothetical protein